MSNKANSLPIFCDTIIVGAGASGLMCALNLKKEFLILEGFERYGAKIAVSGGGKCNFTNETISVNNYLGDDKFIKTVLGYLSANDMLDFCTKNGVAFEKREEGKYFCAKSAKDMVKALAKGSVERIKLNTKVSSVLFEGGVFRLFTSNEEFRCNNLVIASGGVSYPLLGATDIGFMIAESFGHKISEIAPALVGFTVQPSEFWFKAISGVSLNAVIEVADKSFVGSVLFTHKGISGLAILNASLYRQKGSIKINFLPDVDLRQRLQGSRQVSTLLGLPKSFCKAFLERIGVDDKRAQKLTNEDFERLKTLQDYRFAPAGTFGFSKAEITKGGVNTDEIDAKTMQSRLCNGLYFIGEVLDVSGELGGYNFHFAFASAVACAKAVNKN